MVHALIDEVFKIWLVRVLCLVSIYCALLLQAILTSICDHSAIFSRRYNLANQDWIDHKHPYSEMKKRLHCWGKKTPVAIVVDVLASASAWTENFQLFFMAEHLTFHSGPGLFRDWHHGFPCLTFKRMVYLPGLLRVMALDGLLSSRA